MLQRTGKEIIILLVGLFAFGSPLFGQYVEISTEFDTNQIRIGEPCHLNIRVHQPREITVNFPHIADTLVDKVEVLGTWPADTVGIDGDIEISKKYRVTSFDSGLYAIPPLKFSFHSATWSDSITSDPMYLMVHTVPTDSTVYDIKQPMHVPVALVEVLPWVGGGLILLFGTIIIIWYLRRRKKNKPLFAPVKPEDPAHIIAFRELRNLKDEKLWQQNEFKKYYTRLTEIVRRYMYRRYGIQAMEMTSYDIIDAWKRSGEMKEELMDKLNQLLNLADLVKFARQKPLASENEENMDRAYDFIEQTKYVKPENLEEDHE